MKKVLAVLLSLLLLAGAFFVLPAAAEEALTPVTLYVGQAEAAQGETLWVPIWLGADSHLVNLDMVIEYDTDTLRFAGQEDAVQGDIWKGSIAFNEPEAGLVKIAAAKSGTGYTQAGVLVKIAFDVLADSADSADVTLTVPNIVANVDGKDTKTTVRALTGLSVTPPDKTEYTVGEELDTAGMVVTAEYDDDSTAAVTAYTVSEEPLVEGENTITVTYLDQTATFMVEATAPIQPTYTPDKDALETIVNEAEVLDAAKYTEESWAKVQEALTAATELLEDDSVYTGEDELQAAQAAIDAAVEALTAAIGELTDADELMPGDVNEDGAVDSKDARLVLQSAVGAVTLTERQLTIANVNGDAAVDSKDARWILQAAVA